MNYILVQWPESQNFMEEDWFEEEAILAIGGEDKVGSSAYFIPTDRIGNDEDTTHIKLLQRVFELLDSGCFILEEATVEDKKNLNQLKKDIKNYIL